MKKRLGSVLFIALALGGIYLAYTFWPDEDLNWALTSLLLLLLGLGLFYLRYERAHVSSKEMAVIASLAAFAVVGRIIFAPFPNFKPTTYLVILAGYVFGPRAGFMVGTTAAIASNVYFGQGAWTPWQMVAWGLAGASAGVFGRLRGEKVTAYELALFGLLWGFLFGWIMNLWTWLSTVYPLNFETWLLTNTSSLLFDISHAVANVLFALLLTRRFLPILWRFRKKLTITTLEVLPHEKHN
ncbi:ECF transporter S component [Tumebacillus permanentifrigoris]|uniref:Energy-coupling factor transport system substrate-specific component n=1 Tax=Tumebacillus permanentifrigoris TaxID=378543 RepID=A0A316DAE2_9BACL|nr:ECF transporter S component [Tumebacillus permanentifrigoris]PWK13782.1 energy-coupling factor transport system substrate-specific component [Tumebacillus permanentifrigoris]